MKHLLIIILVVSHALFPCGADKDTQVKAVSRSPEGVWKPIAAVLGGARLPQPALDAITLKITGTNYVVTVEGEKEPDKGTSTLDESTSPKRMTITSTNGPTRGKTFLAIYEMKNDQSLRVCYDLSGTEFPKEFKATKGTHAYLVGYRRQIDRTAGDPAKK